MRKIKSPVTTQSLLLNGTIKTLALEKAYWRDLIAAAKENELTLAELVELVETSQGERKNLSSALRTVQRERRSRRLSCSLDERVRQGKTDKPITVDDPDFATFAGDANPGPGCKVS